MDGHGLFVNAIHSMLQNFQKELFLFTVPFSPSCPDWFPAFCDIDEANAAYIACVSRGFWWNDPNALGDVVPVGKKPKVGDDGVVRQESEEGIAEIRWVG